MNVELGGFLAVIIPIVAIELGLMLFALYDLTRPGRRVKGDNKVVWALVVIFVGIIGPIMYLIAGREES